LRVSYQMDFASKTIAFFFFLVARSFEVEISKVAFSVTSELFIHFFHSPPLLQCNQKMVEIIVNWFIKIKRKD
jgi:hypothetical protein